MKAETQCDDKKCAVHGRVLPRGRSFSGTVVATKMQKTAVVEWVWRRKIPKYERYESKIIRVAAHNSSCLNAEKGDKVIIQECRPLSKTKNFVIIKILGKNIEFLGKEESKDEFDIKKKKEKEIGSEETKNEEH